MDLTDEQWAIVKPLLPEQPLRSRGGRPRVNNRRVLNGIPWVMRTEAPWNTLPKSYPSRQVCRRRFNEWTGAGILVEILRVLEEDLEYRQGIKVTDPRLEAPKTARGRASWWWQTVVLLRSSDVGALRGGASERANS